MEDTRIEMAEYPFCVGIKLDVNYDTHVRDGVQRNAFDMQLREDVCLALKVPKANVHIMSHHRCAISSPP